MATPSTTPDDDARPQASPGAAPALAEAAERWSEPVVITGAAVGLPRAQVFDDGNLARILDGEQFIDVIPTRIREAILDKRITRLVKRENGTPSFEVIDDAADVIKLAGRGGDVDLVEQYGVSAERVPALDRTTVLAIGAGIDALRDAGIPMVMRFRTTSLGTQLAQRYQLAEALSDDTGVIFASAFPGGDSLVTMVTDYERDRARREELHELESLRAHVEKTAGVEALTEIDHRIHSLRAAAESDPYAFDRRFLFRALSMGHSQFAELVGARGPNTQINSACASTTQAVALAEDWIHAGRCRRVVIVAADDVTSGHMLEWVASGFLATGAAATDGVVEEAALPFDRRRHGMLIGMGAAAMVVESASAARERGVAPICEVLGAVTANSAFHGTRLDPSHITQVMETLIANVERDWGVSRNEIAQSLLFMSHETYTPARGGSAAAEVESLRAVFGAAADSVVVANTKGFTGHPMGVGIEDVVAIKALETGIVPPVPNYKEVDPDLGTLNLSKGGSYPIRYALRLAAGFGSQIAMTLVRWTPTADGLHREPDQLGYAYRVIDRIAWTRWLTDISGRPDPEVEVVKRTLRVHQDAPAPRAPKAPAKPAVTPAVAVKPAAVVPLATEPVAVATPARLDREVIRQAVLDLVAEKTGYPQDMLDPELDMEADLGVDTVKQAEIFAVIRETYSIHRDENLKLRDFPTINHVIGFVMDRATAPAGTPTSNGSTPSPLEPAEATTVVETPTATAPTLTEAAVPVTTAPVAPGGAGLDREVIRQAVLDLVAEKTGYPQDMLDPELDMEADLGVDTVKQAEIFAVIRETYSIHRDENLKLRDFPTINHVIGFVMDRATAPAGTPTTNGSTPSPLEPAEATTVVETPTAIAPALTEAAVPLTTAPVAPGGAGLDREVIRQAVLDLVAEKTGYPQDMLDPELDMEADLGVDTVKQAEIFAVIRETYSIHRDENLKLRDFPTINHVIGFVMDRATAPAGGPTGNGSISPARPVAEATPMVASTAIVPAPVENAVAATPAPGAGLDRAVVRQAVLDLVAEKTGYPQDMLDPELDMEADLGVDTVKQAEIFAVIRETYSIHRDENLKLRDFPTINHVIGFVMDRATGEAQPRERDVVTAV